MTKSITFAHHKGGTGKTTSCLNIAGFLVKWGYDILIVDIDPQGNATSGLGVMKESLNRTVYDGLVGEEDFENLVLETKNGIHLIPSNLELMGAEPYLYKNEEKKFTMLNNKLDNLTQYYDFVLIDTPPGSNLFLINGVVQADEVFVALDPGVFSIESVKTFEAILKDVEDVLDTEINTDIAILTKCEGPSWFSRLLGKTNPTEEAREELKNMFKKVFSVPKSDDVYESQKKGVPLSAFSSNSGPGRAYRKISKFITEMH